MKFNGTDQPSDIKVLLDAATSSLEGYLTAILNY